MADKPQHMTLYIQNPMLPPKQAEECIFCLDDQQSATNPIKKNDKCDCKFLYHSICQDQYEEQLLLERKPVLCVMCRKERTPSPPTAHYVTVLEIIRIQSQPTRKCKIVLFCIGVIVFILFLLFSYRLFF